MERKEDIMVEIFGDEDRRGLIDMNPEEYQNNLNEYIVNWPLKFKQYYLRNKDIEIQSCLPHELKRMGFPEGVKSSPNMGESANKQVFEVHNEADSYSGKSGKLQ